MQGHTHTGFFAFLFVGVSAVVFTKLLGLLAAYLVERDSTATIGKALGSLVTNP